MALKLQLKVAGIRGITSVLGGLFGISKNYQESFHTTIKYLCHFNETKKNPGPRLKCYHI